MRETWLDSLFPEHPKVVTAGLTAGWLYVAGLCYANRHLTDGFIPSRHVEGLCPQLAELAEDLAETLVDVGLWQRVPDGFEIHDFAEHNETRAELEQQRARWRRRKRKERLPCGKGSGTGPGPVRDIGVASDARERGDSAVAVQSFSSRQAVASYDGALSLPDAQELDVELAEFARRSRPEEAPPRGPLTIAGLAGRLADADARTPAVVATLVRRHRLPEAALHTALEALEQRRQRPPRLVSEARYFVATLKRMADEGQYAR